MVEHDILDFDIVLGMDWLHAYFYSIYSRTRVAKFQFPNELILELKGENSISRVQILFGLKDHKIIY